MLKPEYPLNTNYVNIQIFTSKFMSELTLVTGSLCCNNNSLILSVTSYSFSQVSLLHMRYLILQLHFPLQLVSPTHSLLISCVSSIKTKKLSTHALSITNLHKNLNSILAISEYSKA